MQTLSREHFFRDGITPIPLHEITEIQTFRTARGEKRGNKFNPSTSGSHDLIQVMQPDNIHREFKLPGLPGVLRSLTANYNLTENNEPTTSPATQRSLISYILILVFFGHSR